MSAIIPFTINDLTRHTNPVKMYEYLAAGKPVVGTAMPEIMIGADGLTYIARDGADFVMKLARRCSTLRIRPMSHVVLTTP